MRSRFGLIPLADRERILKAIRNRVQTIERFVTHDMLIRRIGESRRTPRRHMLAALAVGALMFIVIILAVGIERLVAAR